jgi:hypothetical protein
MDRPNSYELHIAARRERARETAELLSAAARIIAHGLRRLAGLAGAAPPPDVAPRKRKGGAAAPPILVTNRM